MTQPISIEFNTEIPDDVVWDEDGEEVVHPGGKAVADVLVALLEEEGLSVSELDEDLEHESWTMELEWRGAGFRLQVLHIDTCYVFVHGGPWLLTRWLSRTAPRQAELAAYVAGLLQTDSRFSNIRVA
ncbi:hypothetical protein [Iodidimonas sp. SYSU 1G8]|uniref:hypothetical protein n=1 Tax=Iodidimonas sp. SYSU 1G8 TaxID=3133967 RepID=UPI0031FF438B